MRGTAGSRISTREGVIDHILIQARVTTRHSSCQLRSSETVRPGLVLAAGEHPLRETGRIGVDLVDRTVLRPVIIG